MINRIDTDYGRFYETPDGVFPSVTSVLSSIPNPGLEAWKAAVGEAEAKRVSQRSAALGTRMHQYCEDFLMNKNPALDYVDRASYTGLEKHLKRVQPLHIEHQMWSKRLRVAGTADCIGYYDGRLCLIDFKSTSRRKAEGEFDSYWLQTACYAQMAHERLGLIIPDLLIIMQNIADGETYVFQERTANWLMQFKSIRDKYTNEFKG